MNNNEINAKPKFGNNIVQVTSSNIQQSEKQAELYAQRAERSMLECANYLSTVQNILALCNSIKDNLENLYFDDLDEHKDDFDNPHKVNAEQVGAYTKSETDSLLSQKQPVGNYLTEHQSLNNYYTKTESDNKYLTSHQDISGKADIADLATVATSGSYNDLTDKPTIPNAQVNADWNASSGVSQILNKPTIPTVPTNISSFTNDAGYLTSHQSLSNYYTKTESDNKYLTSHQDISGKADSADLATVATSGSYNDLTNKPTIPEVNNGTITITQDGVTKGTFSVNQSVDSTIDLDAGGGNMPSILGGNSINVSGGVPDFITPTDTISYFQNNGCDMVEKIGDLYFACSGFCIYTSTDKNTWTMVYDGQSDWFTPSCMAGDGNGNIVVIGSNGDNILVSTDDGTTFSLTSLQISGGYGGQFKDIAYGNGMFLMAGDDRVVAYGTPNNWNSTSMNFGNGIEQISFDGSQFILCYDCGFATTTDGINFTQGTSFTQSGFGLERIAYSNGIYCGINQPNGVIAKSTDLQNWQTSQIFQNPMDEGFDRIQAMDSCFVVRSYNQMSGTHSIYTFDTTMDLSNYTSVDLQKNADPIFRVSENIVFVSSENNIVNCYEGTDEVKINCVVDNQLDANSDNPVKNSVLYNEIEAIWQRLGGR